MSTRHLSRRTILRGIGATMALPLLDAMLPKGGLVSAASQAGATGAASAAAAPTRMACFFIPNGVNMDNWRPMAEGPLGALQPTLAPLAKFKDSPTVFSGLMQDNARSKGDGPGDHARGAAVFLTGAHPFKTAGKDIKLGVSVDQLVAKQVGNRTRLPSLELGLDKANPAGNCDSGYACAYVSNISWASENQPMPKEIDPGAVFDRLFGSEDDRAAAQTLVKRMEKRKSVLDFVAEDANRLNRQLGKNDQRKLDEFQTSIREIEKRVDAARTRRDEPPKPEMARPDGIPGDFGEHYRLMADMLVLAFQMDLTRISTFMVARDGSDRSYRWLGITEGHHTCSHHGRRPEKIESIRKIDLFHMQQFAYFIDRLASIKEGDGTLLDHSMVMLGSGIGDGDRHNHDDLPVIMLGRGNGAIKTGRHVVYPKTPLNNLFLNMAEIMGANPGERFGDSTGRLLGLSA